MIAYGESGFVDTVLMRGLRDGIGGTLKGFSLADLYNMVKTAFFFCLAFDEAITQRQMEVSKNSRTRVTIDLTRNVDSSNKRDPFIIWRAKKHSFY